MAAPPASDSDPTKPSSMPRSSSSPACWPPPCVQFGEPALVARAPGRDAVAQPVLLHRDLAAKLMLLAGFLLEDRIALRLERRKTLIQDARNAPVEPYGAAREPFEQPPIMADQNDAAPHSGQAGSSTGFRSALALEERGLRRRSARCSRCCCGSALALKEKGLRRRAGSAAAPALRCSALALKEKGLRRRMRLGFTCPGRSALALKEKGLRRLIPTSFAIEWCSALALKEKGLRL
jgi:hypothetical protein